MSTELTVEEATDTLLSQIGVLTSNSPIAERASAHSMILRSAARVRGDAAVASHGAGDAGR